MVTVGQNGTIPTPEDEQLPDEYKFQIGDILLCTVIGDIPAIKLEKFEYQTLTDEEIEAHGSLVMGKSIGAKGL